MKALTTMFFFIACITSTLHSQSPLQGESCIPLKDTLRFTVMKDIRYGVATSGISPNDSSSDRLLDIYLPVEDIPHKGFPVFLFIHGGGFSGGNKSDKSGINPICKAMVQKGFAVISMNYYLTMKYHKVAGVSCSSQMKSGLPAKRKFHPLISEAINSAAADAVSVLKWIEINAKKYNLNSRCVALCGGSAGAITALQTAYVLRPKCVEIKAVVNLWGALENPDIITAPAPPLLTYHGDRDELISVEYGNAIQQQMKEIGDTISVLRILKGKGHAQYNYIVNNYIEEIYSFLNQQMK